MNKEAFIKELEKINIKLTKEQENKLEQYYEILVEENEKINLTTITKKEEVYLKHFYDSLTLNKVIDLNQNIFLADLGTGAGFPGIVLKIAFPNLKITLVDSLEKRCKFLKETIKKLELKDIEVICNRIEKFSVENKEKYDVLVTRAVAKTKIMLELGIQALKINGKYILMKSNVEEEIQNIDKTNTILGTKLEIKEEFFLPIEQSKRNILVFAKKTSTNSKHPRDFAKIKKNSL